MTINSAACIQKSAVQEFTDIQDCHRRLDEWIPPRLFEKMHPQFEGKTHWWLRCRDHNGIGPHCRKVGKQILLHVPGVLSWIESKSADFD